MNPSMPNPALTFIGASAMDTLPRRLHLQSSALNDLPSRIETALVAVIALVANTLPPSRRTIPLGDIVPGARGPLSHDTADSSR